MISCSYSDWFCIRRIVVVGKHCDCGIFGKQRCRGLLVVGTNHPVVFSGIENRLYNGDLAVNHC